MKTPEPPPPGRATRTQPQVNRCSCWFEASSEDGYWVGSGLVGPAGLALQLWARLPTGRDQMKGFRLSGCSPGGGVQPFLIVVITRISDWRAWFSCWPHLYKFCVASRSASVVLRCAQDMLHALNRWGHESIFGPFRLGLRWGASRGRHGTLWYQRTPLRCAVAPFSRFPRFRT
jgi:hypothetical protein